MGFGPSDKIGERKQSNAFRKSELENWMDSRKFGKFRNQFNG